MLRKLQIYTYEKLKDPDVMEKASCVLEIKRPVTLSHGDSISAPSLPTHAEIQMMFSGNKLLSLK